jgi:hypothetical protein
MSSCASAPADDAASGDDALTNGITTECSSDSPTNGRCLKEAEVAADLRKAGFPENLVPTMVCTAKWESGFYERATHTNSNKSIDRGIMQVNSVHLGEKGCPSSTEGFFAAQTNASCAYLVYKGQQRNISDPLYGVSRAWAGYRAHAAECKSYHLKSPPAAVASASPASSVASAPADAGAPLASDDDDDSSEESSAGTGSCFAATLGQSVPPGGCYQRQQDSVWFQCKDTLWYRGVSDDGLTGPFGPCDPSYPLDP